MVLTSGFGTVTRTDSSSDKNKTETKWVIISSSGSSSSKHYLQSDLKSDFALYHWTLKNLNRLVNSSWVFRCERIVLCHLK